MKRLIISCFILIVGCSSQRDLIESQFSYKGRYKEYKSFGFVSDESFLYNGLSKYDNWIIQSMVYKRFIAMGYSYNPQTPDLMIAFRYFEEGTSLVSSNQKSLKTWVESLQPEAEDQYLMKRAVNKLGTLSIFFIDGKSGCAVFQGYYKDFKKDNANYKVVSSIGQILDKYQITHY